LVLLLCGKVGAQQRRAPTSGYRGWGVYGGGSEHIRYSRLTQVNRDNVKNLKVAWSYDTGDSFPGSEMQCNPIIVDGVMYATTPKLRVIALDAANGTLKWAFDPNEGRDNRRKSRNRGVMYWSDGKDRRVYVAHQHTLFALDAATGKPIASFGKDGRVDLRENLGRPVDEITITTTTPGAVYKDLIIIGSLVSEGLPSAPGDIRAFDARTGKLRWSFHSPPHPGEFGYDTWPKDAWKYTGGANSWAGMALDEKRGLVFVPTGSAAYDFYGANRKGDNLFANCLIALRADTGKRVWHFQLVKHDVWDRDLPSPPSLVTVRRDGRIIDAVAQTTKSGHVFVFERETGKPLFPIEYRPVPPSDAEGEELAKTQPFPLKPEPFARQVLTEDMLTKRTPEAHQAALERFRKIRSGGQFTPPSREGTIVFPGFDGAAEWGGSAFDPETGLLYVNSNEMAWILRLVERPGAGKPASGKSLYQGECAGCHRDDRKGTPPEFPSLLGLESKYSIPEMSAFLRKGSGRMPGYPNMRNDALNAIARFVLTGRDTADIPALVEAAGLKYTTDGYNKFLDPQGYPAIAPPWGTLNAINLDTGDYAWKIPFGEFPELAAGMKNTGTENYGGPIVTAGGLLFIGATNHDKKFRAFDKRTGELLWETTLPAAGNATPAMYELNGKQYVVIGAGGGKSGTPSGGTYVAFSL
jgi:quinoprotein glucose dehydrogenase